MQLLSGRCLMLNKFATQRRVKIESQRTVARAHLITTTIFTSKYWVLVLKSGKAKIKKMSKIISKRCGVGKSCEHYDPQNKVSGCKVFADRNGCTKSLKSRKNAKVKSLKRAKEEHGGYNYKRPCWAQALGDEWDDYAWTANDF